MIYRVHVTRKCDASCEINITQVVNIVSSFYTIKTVDAHTYLSVCDQPFSVNEAQIISGGSELYTFPRIHALVECLMECGKYTRWTGAGKRPLQAIWVGFSRK